MRLAFVTSHPIQYYAPLFRALAQRLDLVVFFAHRATASDQANAGFGVGFDWDVALLSGYAHEFLRNVATRPALDRFSGCDTPEIAERLRKGRFDVVLVQGWYLKCFFQAALAAKRRRLPLIVRGDSHLDTPRSVLKRAAKSAVYPAFLRLFDAALHVGVRSRAYWRHYGYPASRLFFSPHCVDAAWFAARATAPARVELRARLGIGSEAKVALFAGKLVPLKRPMDLITAAVRLRANGRDLCILVAGAGPLEREIVGGGGRSRRPAPHARLLQSDRDAEGLRRGRCSDPALRAGDVGSRRQRGARLRSPGCVVRRGGLGARSSGRRLGRPRVPCGQRGSACGCHCGRTRLPTVAARDRDQIRGLFSRQCRRGHPPSIRVCDGSRDERR